MSDFDASIFPVLLTWAFITLATLLLLDWWDESD